MNWPQKPLIGMLHLGPLPGAPAYGGDLAAVRDAARRDADALTRGGVDALVIENFGDSPFLPGRVPASVVAHVTAIAAAIRAATPLPIGINLLRNDGIGALAVAHAVGAAFVRVNVLCGARVTDQGVIEGIAHELLRDRRYLAADSVQIFADVSVKHSTPLGKPRPIEDEVRDTLERGRADAVVVSGAGTGQRTDPDLVLQVRRVAHGTPVLVGSGVDVHTLASYWPHADGFIVGTSLKVEGRSNAPVDPKRVRELVEAAERLRHER